jgi:DNA-directed RNA polymerase subunit RPC12/RpoP
MMNTSNSNDNPNRRAQRSYHCYACQNEWRQLVNPSDLAGVQCPSCASEFFEETKSYQQEVAIAQPEPVQQQQQQQNQ